MGAGAGADLQRDVDAVPFWWHRIDLGNGIVTPGRDDTPAKLARLGLPARLDGMSVLDIGAFDGFFSFEAERRGAARVVALDTWNYEGTRTKAGFEIARRALGSHVEDIELDVMDVSVDRLGTFDLVLFLGVLYHLQDPLGGLRRVAEVTGRHLVVETLTDRVGGRRPAMAFYPAASVNEDRTTWWGPNEAAVEAMLREVDFGGVRRVHRSRRGRRGRAIYHAFR